MSTAFLNARNAGQGITYARLAIDLRSHTGSFLRHDSRNGRRKNNLLAVGLGESKQYVSYDLYTYQQSYRTSLRASWNSWNSLLFFSNELKVWPIPPWEISSRAVRVRRSKISRVISEFELISVANLSRSYAISLYLNPN